MKLFPSFMLIGIVSCATVFSRAAGINLPSPVTARDFYNTGTELLGTTNFTEAERMFHSALDTQDEQVRPKALFNLAETRFEDGAAALKAGSDNGTLPEQAMMAGLRAGLEMHRADSAMAENDLSKMIATYRRGRGARHELVSVEKAIQQAMELYGETLRKWQRAADDFKSAAELNSADTNATRNAEIVERHIAQLVDSLRQMQSMAASLGEQQSQLKNALSQLRGKIPKENLPPGDGDGDEGDEGLQPESLAGLQEGATRTGDQMNIPLSPDEAAQMLNSISPDSSRRLPVNDGKNEPTREKAGRTW